MAKRNLSPSTHVPSEAMFLQIYAHLAAAMTLLAAFSTADQGTQQATLKTLRRAHGQLREAGGLMQKSHDAYKDRA